MHFADGNKFFGKRPLLPECGSEEEAISLFAEHVTCPKCLVTAICQERLQDIEDEPKRLKSLPAGKKLPGDPIESFLVYSYMYYVLDASPLSDADFDSHCRWLRHNFSKVVHPFKHLVGITDLRCSGYHGDWGDVPDYILDIARKRVK